MTSEPLGPPPVAFQVTITLDGQLQMRGVWLGDRQRCDDALLEIWMGIRKYHNQLAKGPTIDVPDPAVQKKLLGS